MVQKLTEMQIGLSKQMQLLARIGIVCVWALIAVLAIGTMYQQCSGPRLDTVVVHDTIQVKADTIKLYAEKLIPQWFMRTTRDTIRDTMLQEKIVEREVLRRELDSAKVSEVLSLDTLVHHKLTVNGNVVQIPFRTLTETDCIHHSLCQTFIFADTTITLQRQIEIQKADPKYGIGIGIQYGMAADGKMVPTIGIHISRLLITF